MKKTIKIFLIFLCSLIIGIGLILGISFAVLAGKTESINDDFSSIYTNEKYRSVVGVDDIEVITQEISCGYAVIEMFSTWNGRKITEQNLFDKYGKITTSTGKAFCNEFNKQFPEYKTQIYKYLKNSELIDKVYNSLADGIPVPFEWAAKFEDEWTLHYSLIMKLDIPNDTITIANPYGYIENLTIKDFLEKTSFKSFENMPLFYQMAFAFGIFEKNTIFVATKKN